MRYLDPKADLTFKKVFGEHKDLMKSFLNALLPLNPDQEIEDLEYLTPELVPETPMKKHSIVDVRCRDIRGRHFIVEMQTFWNSGFEQRLLFNAAKAYVRQLDRTDRYTTLQPVYALGLIDAVPFPDLEDFYHVYRFAHERHADRVIPDLQLVFIELPKFRPSSLSDRRMAVLWLRFLTEINEHTCRVPEELLDSPEVSKALGIVEESAFDSAQLARYESFWDMVRVENTRYDSAFREGLNEGIVRGIVEGEREKALSIARQMRAAGLPVAEIERFTGIGSDELD